MFVAVVPIVLDRFLIEKFLVFWRDGRLREVVAHEGSAVIN